MNRFIRYVQSVMRDWILLRSIKQQTRTSCNQLIHEYRRLIDPRASLTYVVVHGSSSMILSLHIKSDVQITAADLAPVLGAYKAFTVNPIDAGYRLTIDVPAWMTLQQKWHELYCNVNALQ